MRILALIVAGVAAATSAALPGTAWAGFVAETISVSDATAGDRFPVVASDGAGRTTVVWFESIAGQRHVVARRVGADRSGPRLVISDGAMLPMQTALAVTPAGRSLVVWAESSDGTPPLFLRGRWIEADGALGAAFLIRNAGIIQGAANPTAAVTATGDAVVAWRNPNSTPAYRTEARRVGADGSLGTLLQPVEGPGLTGGPRVAPAAGGALVAWIGSGGVWTMPVDTAGVGGAVQNPVATGASGSLGLTDAGPAGLRTAWTPVGEADSAATQPLAPTGAAVGPRRSLDTVGAPASFMRLASGPDGRSIAVWGRSTPVVAARTIGADGVPGSEVLAAPATPAEHQFVQDAGVLSDGTGLVLWVQAPPGQQRRLWARVVDPGGTAESPVALSEPGADSARVSPTVPGGGLIVWEQREPGAATSAVVARRWLPPPTCAPAQGTVVQGQPTDIALTCSGPGLSGVEILSGPARGTAQATGPASVRYSPAAGFAGTDAFTFRPLGLGGAGPAATATVAVGRDTLGPAILRFALNRRRIALRTAFRVRPPRRPSFVVRVGEPATFAIAVQRRVGPRWRGVGVLRRRSLSTAATVRLGRRVGRRALIPGRYRARLRATDALGNRSGLRGVSFLVTRR